MGEVYRARDSRLDRTVAIKVLPSHLTGDSEAQERFDREARSISSLSHPNVCQLYDVGSQDGTSYLVMEFLDGETLADRLLKGPLPLPQFFKISIEICEGLTDPDSGRVELLGLNWRTGAAELRQRIGIQLQETQFPDKATVEETLRLFRDRKSVV